tara:strand:- start:668 stop:1303 length:636 start_codon:yes stop_codon:yes gene_type:complete
MLGSIDLNLSFIFFVLCGYLLGSIPFGLVLTRLSGLGDIRSIGSGNIGATNVLRSGSKRLAAATLFLDGGKGWLAVFLTEILWNKNNINDIGLVIGFVCVIGHIFPVWLKFRGGKGVATTIGVLFGNDLMLGIVTCFIWLIIAVLFRYSSLAALLALSAAPVYAFWFEFYPLMYTAIALALLSTFCHRANIERLLKGEETKIGVSNNKTSN